MATEPMRTRRLRAGPLLILALAGFGGCNDFVDSPGDFDVELTLLAPDSIPLGVEATLVLEIRDAAGQTVKGVPVTWSLSGVAGHEEAQFQIDTLADPTRWKLRAVRVGEAVVTAGVSGPPVGTRGVQKTISSAAYGVRIVRVDTLHELVLFVGQDSVLEAQPLSPDGLAVSGGTHIDWRLESSTPEPQATVMLNDGSGRIGLHGNRVGDALLIAQASGCMGRCADSLPVRVIQTLAGVSIDSVGPLASLGERTILRAHTFDTYGQIVGDAQAQWSLTDAADSQVVTLAGDTVTARSNGSARIVATVAPFADTITVDVWQSIGRISVESRTEWSEYEFPQGHTDTLAVTVLDANNRPLERPFSLSASSSDTGVVRATMLENAIEFVSVAPGPATVVVQGEGVTESLNVIVKPQINELDVRLDNDTLNYLSSTGVAQAWGLVDGEWVETRAVFSSSDDAVVEMQSNGRYVARSTGTAWIRGDALGLTDSTLVTARQVMKSFAVDPEVAMVAIGGAIPIRAFGYDSAGNTMPASDVSYESDEPAVLSVAVDGTATAHAMGQATVTATSGSFQASTIATGIPPVVGAALGFDHVCFLVQGGTLYCSGANWNGQLGDGTLTPRPRPVRAGSPLTFNSVVAGNFFTCAIASDQGTYCWGNGQAGQLGNGATSNSAVPVQVSGDPGFVELSAAAGHVCGRTQDGTVYCWGANDAGQTGVGYSGPVTVPTAVAGGLSFRMVAAGQDGGCAVSDDGAPYCWGTAGVTGSLLPVALASPSSYRVIDGAGCAVAVDGSLHCPDGPQMEAVGDGRVYETVAAGYGFHCALGVDGRAYCFGSNFWGQLATGDYFGRSDPTPARLDRTATFLVLAMGGCAGNPAGGLACWGRLDDGSYFRESPVPWPFVYP